MSALPPVGIGGETTINFYVAIACVEHIQTGPNNAIPRNANILGGNMH
jgi:hypothetical protein